MLLIDLQQLLDQGHRFNDVGKGTLVALLLDDLVELTHCCVGLLVVLGPEVALGQHQAQLAVGLVLC